MENGGFHSGGVAAERLAEPYFSTKTRGSGLGLSIALRIVQAHGGTIVLTPIPHERLRIDVSLPLSDSGVAAPAGV
jgi:signal transduction histidine kinase